MYGIGPAGGDFGGAFAEPEPRIPFADAMLVPLPKDIDPLVAASAPTTSATPGARWCRRSKAGPGARS